MKKWLSERLRAIRDRRKHEVVFYTYPKGLFFWPIIVMGYLLWLFGDKADSEILAWVWAVTLLVVLVAVGFDINRNHAIFWLVVIIALWFIIMWLRDVKDVLIFKHLYDFFADLDPAYSRSLGLIVSIVLSVFCAIMWIWTRINSKWRITHNEFEHYQFGRMDDSLARGAKRIRSSYPDLFEFFLCLAGDLIIFDASGRRELRRIPHVPMLPLVRKRINRLMEVTAVTAADIEAEEMDAYESDATSDDSEDRSV